MERNFPKKEIVPKFGRTSLLFERHKHPERDIPDQNIKCLPYIPRCPGSWVPLSRSPSDLWKEVREEGRGERGEERGERREEKGRGERGDG
jgi:hypothetical protein